MGSGVSLWLLALAVLYLPSLLAVSSRKRPGQCEEITIPICESIEYKHTYMPNQFHQSSQEEVAQEINQFWPLIQIKCSPDLQFFLCSMYVPICLDEYDEPLTVCRSVCERAKAGCVPLMTQYGFQWPARMRCDQFPIQSSSNQLCMDNAAASNSSSASQGQHPTVRPGNGVGGRVTLSTLHPPQYSDDRGHVDPALLPPEHDDGQGLDPPAPRPPGHKEIPASDFPTNDRSHSTGGGHPDPDAKTVLGSIVDIIQTIPKKPHDPCECKCNSNDFVKLAEESTWYNKVYTGGVANCAVKCRGAYFGADEHEFVEWWLRVWSSLCLLSTFVTVFTFLLDTNRFQYPERPVIFLSACYFMVSIGYVIRLVAGHEAVACHGETIRYQSTGPALCTVTFLLLYIFGMASSLWWVILSLTWFLSAGLKWGQEAIASYSQYFHLVAWSIPCIKTVTILLLSSVDGDPVAGVCYVGNQDPALLRWFVLFPLCFYLLLGTSFLVAGFVSLFRIRSVIKQQGGQKTEKLEKLMIRIGIFSLLYTLPATVVIACYFYEDSFKQEWELSRTCPCADTSSDRPDFIIFMLKYFMFLVVGITSGCWVWSSKTVETWRNVFSRQACSAHRQKKIEAEAAIKSGEMYASISRPLQPAPGHPLSHV